MRKAIILAMFVFGVQRVPVIAANPPELAKIVGTWELIKVKDQTVVPMTIEFTNNGKVTLKISDNGNPFTAEGTFKLDKDTIVMSVELDEKVQERKCVIKSLSDDSMCLYDDFKVTSEFRRKGAIRK